MAIIVKDFNAIAALANKKSYSAGEVALIASVTCSFVRVAIRDGDVFFAANRARMIVREFEKEVPRIKRDSKKFREFIQQESQVFKQLGLSERARSLILAQLESQQKSEGVSIPSENEVASILRRVEERSCDLRTVADKGQSRPADEKETDFALAAIETTGGLTVMAGNVLAGSGVAVGSGGAAVVLAGVLVAVSCSEGYNYFKTGIKRMFG